MPPKRVSLRDRTAHDAALTPAPPIPPFATEAESPLWGTEQVEQVVVELELRTIMPNRYQPRANPGEARLDELAESIRTHGVIQPVIVRAIPLTKYEGTGRHYELIAGERRWRASALAGRTTIPALIRREAADHRTMLELALIENLQRQDLHPLDEATAFGQFQAELGYSYSEIAARIGKSKTYVSNRMRLLQLDEDLRALVAARPDTIKHVYELARIADPLLRTPLVLAVRDEDLSRAATKMRVDALLGGTDADKSVSQDTERDALHEDLTGKSVSQDTERDALHEDLTITLTLPAGEEAADQMRHDLRLHREMQTIGRMLDRWEQHGVHHHGDSRAAILRNLDEVRTRLERIARTLSDPDTLSLAAGNEIVIR